MKQTLLEMTQDILSSLDGDEVNSINDNVESQQVARVIRSCYNTITSRANLPELYDQFELIPSNDNTKPTLMTLPTNVVGLMWVKYNIRTLTEADMNFQMVTPLPLLTFLNQMHTLRETDAENGTFTYGTTDYLYRNNKPPEFYTSPDDNALIFDSYDSQVDTTLQASKTAAYGEIDPVFELSDLFVPDLDSKQFDLLLNESKALAFAEMKQASHTKAESNARKGWIHTQKTKENVLGALSDFSKMPNYGRRR